MAKEDLKWQACLPSAGSPMLQGIPTAMRIGAALVDSVGYKKQKVEGHENEKGMLGVYGGNCCGAQWVKLKYFICMY